MPLGCPLEKDRYETSLLRVLVYGSSATIMFYRMLSKSVRFNKVIYGFSKPFCTACNFCRDVFGEHVSRWNKVWAFFFSEVLPCDSAAIMLWE